MTLEEARDKLEILDGGTDFDEEAIQDLVSVVEFLFNVLDARQMLDNVPWKGMNQ